MHEGVEIAPLIAMLHRGLRPLPAGAPDTAQNGLEADAVLVGRPELHHVLRVDLSHRLHYSQEIFLTAACVVGYHAHVTWSRHLLRNPRTCKEHYVSLQ